MRTTFSPDDRDVPGWEDVPDDQDPVKDFGGLGTDPGGPLPPVELAPIDELEAAARASLGLQRLITFTRHFERPRKLTSQGNLTLADGRALLPLLGMVGEEGSVIRSLHDRMRSTADSRHLTTMLRWARAAGFVKVRHGSLSATKRGRDLGKHPLTDWRTAFETFVLDAVLDPGPRDRFHAWWIDGVAEIIATLPVRLYATEGMEVEMLKTTSRSCWSRTSTSRRPWTSCSIRGAGQAKGSSVMASTRWWSLARSRSSTKASR